MWRHVVRRFLKPAVRPTVRRFRPSVESLEARAVPAIVSVGVSGSTLNVSTDNWATTVEVFQTGDQVRVRETGWSPYSFYPIDTTYDFPAAGISSVNVTGGAGSDRISNYSALPMTADGRGGHDNLRGGEAADWLVGGTGNDYVAGWGGDDVVSGMDGADSLDGGFGNDWLYGDGGDDRMSGDGGNDNLYGDAGRDLLRGGVGNDRLTGGDEDDQLLGQDGDDRLYGLGGQDNLIGGAGTDALYGGEGDDTLVAIDAFPFETVNGEGGRDAVWADQTSYGVDAVSGTTTGDAVRWVTGFWNGADRTLNGDRIADPTDGTDYQSFGSKPLFGSAGPRTDDVVQGNLGDCWLVAGMASVAHRDPTAVRQTVADFGDGTYGVWLGGRAYRVDADLPTYAGTTTPQFAQLGHDDSLWVAVVEKAYTHHRTGANTYGSLNGGWGVEALRGLNAAGVGDRYFDTYASGQAILDDIAAKLASGLAMTLGFDGVVAAGCPCVGGHEYTVVGVTHGWRYDSWSGWTWGVTGVQIRNPWGFDGVGSDGADDGYLTVTGDQLFASLGSIAWGRVGG